MKSGLYDVPGESAERLAAAEASRLAGPTTNESKVSFGSRSVMIMLRKRLLLGAPRPSGRLRHGPGSIARLRGRRKGLPAALPGPLRRLRKVGRKGGPEAHPL